MSIHSVSRTRIEIEVNGSCFSYEFHRKCVLFFLGQHRFCHVCINTIHDSNPRDGIVFKQRWNLNFHTLSIIMIENFMFKTGPILLFLRIHPLIRVPFHFDASCIIGINVASVVLLLYIKSIEVLSFFWTSFKSASEHNLDNFGSSDKCSNFRSYYYTRFHSCCALVWYEFLQ